MGRGTTSSKALYRSYFPTVLTRWWKERVLRVGKFICFDACPLPACLPYTAKRMAKITPNAKLIFMVSCGAGLFFGGGCWRKTGRRLAGS